MTNAKKCENCGKLNLRDALRCMECNFYLGTKGQAGAPNTNPDNPQVNNPPEASEPTPKRGVNVNKIIFVGAIMLIWLLISLLFLRAVTDQWWIISLLGFGIIITFFVLPPFIPEEYRSTFTGIALVVWFLVIIFLLWKIEPIRKSVLLTGEPIFKPISIGWSKFTCVISISLQGGVGDTSVCDEIGEQKTEKIGSYSALDIKEGRRATTQGSVNYLKNPKPIGGKPYAFTLTLENNNPKITDYLINVTDMVITTSSNKNFRTAEVWSLKTTETELPRTIYPEDYWVVRADLDVPACDFYTYHRVNVFSEQTGGSVTELAIFKELKGNENRIREFDPVVKINPGPVDAVAFIDTKQGHRAVVLNESKDFDVFVRLQNNGDDSNATIRTIKLTSTLDDISLSCNGETQLPITIFDKYSDKGTSAIDIICSGRVDVPDGDIDDKVTALISVSVEYEYTQELTFTKPSVCEGIETSNGGTGTTIPVTVSDTSDVKEKIASKATELGISPKIALAIADVESEGSFQHYGVGACGQSYQGNVKKGCDDEVGLMQITPNTGKRTCGYSIDELLDIDKNIECGVRVIKDKHTAYLPTSATCNMFDSHSICYDPNDCGYRYEDEWDRAIRGYNGWGCLSEDNRKYVETVNLKRDQYSAYV